MATQKFTTNCMGHKVEIVLKSPASSKKVYESVPFTIADYFAEQIEIGVKAGSFKDFADEEMDVGGDGNLLSGSWNVVELDFELFVRIHTWLEHTGAEKALPAALFTRQFGKRKGYQFFKQWTDNDCDLLKMLVSFKSQPLDGQQFCTMVLAQVEELEQREQEFSQKQLRVEHEWLERHVQAFLKDGLVYSITLKDGSHISDAVFHKDPLFNYDFFRVGGLPYGIEKVYSHSLVGHEVPPETTTPDPDNLLIKEQYAETVDVWTTPDTNPETFRRRVQCLMLSGLTKQEAERDVAAAPMQLELFYEIGLGGFAIDAEAVGNTVLYNPYDGQKIPE